MTRLMDGGVRATEAARRLGIDGADAYRMLFAGELDGGPGRDGVVYFDEASIEAYLERHGFGVVAEPSTGSSTGSIGTAPPEPAQPDTPAPRKPRSAAQDGTERHEPSGGSVNSKPEGRGFKSRPRHQPQSMEAQVRAGPRGSALLLSGPEPRPCQTCLKHAVYVRLRFVVTAWLRYLPDTSRRGAGTRATLAPAPTRHSTS